MKIGKDAKIVIAAVAAATAITLVIVGTATNSITADTNKDVERYEEINRRIADTLCPKCNGKMENGFIIDRGQRQSYVGTWVQGTPQAGANGVNSEPGSVFVTMRCKACGYLESYAK